VVRIKGMMFLSSAHAGTLYRLLVQRLIRKGKDSLLWVVTKDTEGLAKIASPHPSGKWHHITDGLECFADRNVYTNTRVFRCYRNSKLKRGAQSFVYLGESRDEEPTWDRFRFSLARYLEPGDHITHALTGVEMDGSPAQSSTHSDVTWTRGMANAGHHRVQLRSMLPKDPVRNGYTAGGQGKGVRQLPDNVAGDMLNAVEEFLVAHKKVSLYQSRSHGWIPSCGYLDVASASKECAVRAAVMGLKSYEHSSNHVSFRIDLRRGKYQQRCMSGRCRDAIACDREQRRSAASKRRKLGIVGMNSSEPLAPWIPIPQELWAPIEKLTHKLPVPMVAMSDFIGWKG